MRWWPLQGTLARRRWAVAGTAVRSVLRFRRAGRERRRSLQSALAPVPEASAIPPEPLQQRGTGP